MPADRIDVHRNREALLRAASALFAEEGSGVPLARVAAAAGLGVGTLYRHFPNRVALVSATYEAEVGRLGEIDELLALPTGADALAAWLGRFLDFAEAKRPIADIIHSPSAAPRPPARGTMEAALDRILATGVADGSLRADADADDVLRATMGIWTDQDAPDWRPRGERLMQLVVDGLRPR